MFCFVRWGSVLTDKKLIPVICTMKLIPVGFRFRSEHYSGRIVTQVLPLQTICGLNGLEPPLRSVGIESTYG